MKKPSKRSIGYGAGFLTGVAGCLIYDGQRITGVILILIAGLILRFPGREEEK